VPNERISDEAKARGQFVETMAKGIPNDFEEFPRSPKEANVYKT
jgi:hypothetical protein